MVVSANVSLAVWLNDSDMNYNVSSFPTLFSGAAEFSAQKLLTI